MATATQLRSQHPRFLYQSYDWDWSDQTLTLQWHFKIEPDLEFHPTMKFNHVSEQQYRSLSQAELEQHVFSIGLSELFSYWKLTASPEIIINAGKLNQDQLAWWRRLLIKGMGEYFFVNQIDFTAPQFVSLTSQPNDSPRNQAQGANRTPASSGADSSKAQPSQSKREQILIPLGGGKDSVVTLELFRQHHPTNQLGCLLINPTQAAEDIAQTSQLETITVARELDPLLLSLNDQGYLNGHIPISAVFAFTSLLAAKLHNYQYVAISNERSSNEGNVMFQGQEINHQYSKTFSFEQSFSQYVHQYYPSNTANYFSFVRPLYELQIGKIFAKMSQYHPLFRSCNVGQETNSWCGQCSKCLFTYIALYPFMDPEQLAQYFGENLLENVELLPIALELAGVAEQKPLECVGTHEEVIAAFYLCWQKAQQAGTTPALLEQVHQQVLQQQDSLEKRAQTVLAAWNKHHLIPKPTWETWLKEALK